MASTEAKSVEELSRLLEAERRGDRGTAHAETMRLLEAERAAHRATKNIITERRSVTDRLKAERDALSEQVRRLTAKKA